jgi:acyl-CoA thioester hydrolase
MADRFSHPIQVHPSDIDDMGHVNNVIYLRWVQEVAVAHWLASAPAEIISSLSWVVLRHEIDYKAPVYLTDQITGYTWVGQADGARFERFVQLRKGDTVVAEAKTIWCMLDSQTGKPKRITPEIIQTLSKS